MSGKLITTAFDKPKPKMATIKILVGWRYRTMKIEADQAGDFVRAIVSAGLTEMRGARKSVYHPPHMIRRVVIRA